MSADEARKLCYEVFGSSRVQEAEDILQAHGYSPEEVDVRPTDGGPGWSDWVYDLCFVETPDRPVAAELKRKLGLQPRGLV